MRNVSDILKDSGGWGGPEHWITMKTIKRYKMRDPAYLGFWYRDIYNLIKDLDANSVRMEEDDDLLIVIIERTSAGYDSDVVYEVKYSVERPSFLLTWKEREL